MTIWFTADQHFGHANIIKHCSRPFADVGEMDKGLIEGWNLRVEKEDTVYDVGDFAFRGNPAKHYLDRLNGRKVLITGNHDVVAPDDPWEAVENYRVVKWSGQTFVLFHYPMEEWDGYFRGTIHLHGHVHSKTPAWGGKVRNRIDVGVDANRFMPVAASELLMFPHMELRQE